MRLAVAPIAFLAAGCSAPQQAIRVTELLANCDAHLGKPVQVAGYLGACAGYDCHLYADAAAKAGSTFETRSAEIGIGGSESFDRKAAPFQNRYVVLSGTVAKDSCTGAGGTDRSPGINPTDIRAWTPSEGAPANTQ